MDQVYDRVQNPAGDKEQDRPYQVVDLPPQFGRSLLDRLGSPEDGSQEEDDRNYGNKDRDQLVHIVSLRLLNDA
jgi:hypothetical protein